MHHWSRLCRHVATLKILAGWKSIRLAGMCSTLLGFVGDFVEPKFPLLPYALGVAVTTFFASEIIRLRVRAPLGTMKSRWLARTSVSSGVGAIVLAVAVGANASFRRDDVHDGMLASISENAKELQTRLLGLGETTTATLEISRRVEAETSRTAEISRRVEAETSRTAEIARRVEEETSRTGAATNRIDERDRLADASSLLDRVASDKDFSDRGQATAMETLAAAGRSFAFMDFSGMRLQGLKIPKVDLEDANLMMTDLSNAVMVSAGLSQANLRFAILNHADFTGARLVGTQFAFAKADDAKLNGTKGEGANFYAASLRGARFRKAELRGANLSFADLRDADLEGADLTDASLVGAMIAGANLRDAKIANTDFTGVATNAGAFSSAQWAGTCRRATGVGVRGSLIERIPNQRFRGGIEYSMVMDLTINSVGPGAPGLPVCQFGTAGPRHLNFGIGFETELLRKVNRRKAIVVRVNEHFKTIGLL